MPSRGCKNSKVMGRGRSGRVAGKRCRMTGGDVGRQEREV